MSRWYSKRRKAMNSATIKQYGFMPQYALIHQGMRKPYSCLSGLVRRKNHNECDYCTQPKKGSYASVSGFSNDDVDFYICGKCAVRTFYKQSLAHQIEWRGK